MSKAAFVDLVTADQPDAPSYFTYDAVLNSKERPTLDETLERVNPLTLDQVLALQDVGAQILDTRDPAEFAAAHLAGSLNIGLARAIRDVGRHGAEPRAPDRDHCRPRPRTRGDHAARTDRLRPRRRLSRRRAPQPRIAAGSDEDDRAPQRAGRIRARRWRCTRCGPATRRCTCSPRAQAEAHRRERQHSSESSRRATGGAAGRPSAHRLLRRRLSIVDCREHPAAATDSPMSARLQAASRHGRPQACRSRRTPATRPELTCVRERQLPNLQRSTPKKSCKTAGKHDWELGIGNWS